MKKKLLTLALTATMAISTVISAFAADTISGGWWSAWTPGYEVKDSVEFDIEVKGGAENWNNVSAVFVNKATTGTKAPADEVGADYKEYAVVRADNWGWGGGDNLSVDGKAIEYTSDIQDAGNDGDTWDDFKAIMKDAHIDATVTKTATGIELKYAVTGANGQSFNYTAKTDVDTSAGLYVFFACDTSEVTVALADGAKEEATTDDEKKTEAKDDEKTTTKAPVTTKAPAEDKEDGMNPVVIVVIVVVAVVVVAGIVVATKKKN